MKQAIAESDDVNVRNAPSKGAHVPGTPTGGGTVADLTVVVVTWNSAEFVEDCLSAVLCNDDDLRLQVLLIDNASSDDTVERVRLRFPQVEIIENSRNEGCSVGFNQGLSAAAGDYIQILCPDTIVQPGAFDAMLGFLKDNPETGAVGPRLIYPDGRPQPSCRTFPTFTTFAWEFLGISRLFPRHPVFGRWRMGDFDHLSLREVDQPRGSSLMVRRQVVDQVGLWDENLEMFFNDVDWCKRIKAQGWKIHFLPDATMIHHGGSSVRQVRPKMILASHRCCYRYFRKHYRNPFATIGVWILGFGLAASAGIRYLVARASSARSRTSTP